MSEAANELKAFAVDDIFGDTTMLAARRVFKEYTRDSKIKVTLAEYLAKEIIADEIDLINYRTNQQNDPGYLGLLLEWFLVGEYLSGLCDGETQIPMDTIQSFVHVDTIVHSLELDDDFMDTFSLYTDEMYIDSFIDIMQGFIVELK